MIFFSIIIGILDGLGLSMFLPLLQMVSDSEGIEAEKLGELRFLIDFISELGIPLKLLTILMFMAIFFFIKGIFQYFGSIYKVNIQQHFIKNLRNKTIQGLNNLDYKYFVSADAGRIQNTLTGEIARVATSYQNYFDALQYGILVIVFMGFAFFIDFKFAVLVSVGGLLTNFIFKHLYKKTKGASRALTGDNNIFQSLIIQNVANYKYLKATGSLIKYGKKLQESVVKIEYNNKKIGKLDAILTSAREPLLITVVVVVIYIQTSLLGSELGPILISLLFFYRALSYLMQMQVRRNKFLAVSGSLENIQLFGKELKVNKEILGEQILNDPINSLCLRNVTFRYDNRPVLSNISLNIKKNEIIAFVGESGSGKTTLVNILSGLLKTEEGNYIVNDLDSEKLNMISFQNKIGYITQDPVIFNDNLYNNVSFWDDRTEENLNRFWHSLKQAEIYDFVMNLPLNENTILGNNGINISGGQRQRISIARELYKKIEILILDEATSALDSETEKSIQKNIDKLKGNFTILIVAHRLSTIKNADKIVLMEQGTIKEVGNYKDLLSRSQYFKRMVSLQEL